MSVIGRLYRGDTRIRFIEYRKRWYVASAIVLLICIGSLAFRGFNLGIEFAGGNQYIAEVKSGTSLSDVRKAVEETGVEIASAQTRGSGAQRKYVIRVPELKSESERTDVAKAVARAAKISNVDDVNVSQVSSSWGSSITNRALIGLAVFLLLVAVYLWIRYERAMALAALGALVHDLLLTAGVYSIVGFEVTPGTVIGLLTILGYSLYDTVVVFDKVDENTRGILGHNRFDYPQAANLAVNQTLMRSINTSLIALLPVSGLLFIGAGVLGVGTLKDLALVLFVGMMTGAYSSLFLATPWLVDIKMLDPKYKNHSQRVASRRAAIERGEEPDRRASRAARAAKAKGEDAPTGAGKGAAAKPGSSKSAAGKPGARTAGSKAASANGNSVSVVTRAEDESDLTSSESEPEPAASRAGGSAPRAGARPAPRKRRQGGKRR